jgi:hypothetical protein
MATLYSTEGALQNNPTAKSLAVAEAQQASMIYCEGTYIADASEVVNDVVRMFKIPEGYRAIPTLFSVDTDGLAGTSTIISVGTETTPAAFAASLDITAAGIEKADDSGSESLTPATVSVVEEWCVAKFTTSTAAPTAAKKFIVRGFFAKA